MRPLHLPTLIVMSSFEYLTWKMAWIRGFKFDYVDNESNWDLGMG